MKGKLPWWLVVILGWLVVAACGAAGLAAAPTPLRIAREATGLLGAAWYVLILGAALIALALVIAIVRGLISLASSRQWECALAIWLPPLAVFLYNLFLWLGPRLRR